MPLAIYGLIMKPVHVIYFVTNIINLLFFGLNFDSLSFTLLTKENIHVQKVIISGCCEQVTVEYTVRNGAIDARSEIFTSYTLGEGTINGHNYYISEDESIIISFRTSCGKWAFHSASLAR